MQLDLLSAGWICFTNKNPKEGQLIVAIRLDVDGQYREPYLMEYHERFEEFRCQLLYWLPAKLPAMPAPLPNNDYEFEVPLKNQRGEKQCNNQSISQNYQQ